MRKNWKSESSFGGGFFCRYHGPVARDRLFNTLDARPRRTVLRPCYGCLLDWHLSLLPNVRPVQPIDELPARRVDGPKAPTKPPSLVPGPRIKRLAPVEHSVVVELEQLSGSQVDRIRTRVHILKPLRELGPGTHCRARQALPFPQAGFKFFEMQQRSSGGIPRAALRFALGYLLMPLWGCGIDDLNRAGAVPRALVRRCSTIESVRGL